MNKRVVYFGIFTVLSMLIITSVLVNKSTNKWEPAENIKVSMGAFSGNLQEAINQDLFKGLPKIAQETTFTGIKGHGFGDIWIYIEGQERTLKNAIQNTQLCGLDDNFQGYSNSPDQSHLGTEIEVTTPYDGNTKSLQDAINDGTLVAVDGNWTECADDYQYCTNPSPFCGGDNCPGDLDGDGIKFCGTYLVNEVHSTNDCTNAGGTVYDTGSAIICRLSGSSCPSGWTQYEGWSRTSRGERIIDSPWWGINYLHYTNSHGFSNNGNIESCSCDKYFYTNCGRYSLGTAKGDYPNCPQTIRASRVEIGCY